MLPLARQIGIAEVQDAQRAYRDFAFLIGKYASTPSQVAELDLDVLKPEEFQAKPDKLIVHFRRHLTMHDNKAQHPHSAFSAAEGEDTGKVKEKDEGK